MEITFWEWLLLPTPELVLRGVPLARVTPSRLEQTGHRRPMDLSWAPTFGSWGRVSDAEALAAQAGKSVERVKQYAKERGLRFANRNMRRTHAELAIALWCDRGSLPRDSCRRFGVLPGERRILCSAAQLLADATEGGITAVLKWPMLKLKAQFSVLKLEMQPPAALLANARTARSERTIARALRPETASPAAKETL
jgi:hypothetical protein